MLNIILFLFLGIAIGILTGLVPGLHPNTISIMVLSFSYLLLPFGSLPLLVFLVSLGITNSIVDFIPSIILGAPEAGNALSVLPGHKLLLEGKGQQAVYLTVKGGFYSVLFITLLFPLLVIIFPSLYSIIKPSLAYVLILLSISLISMEKNKILAILFFALAGILGIISSNLPINNQYALFPLLTGLFGFSILLNQIRAKTNIPKQITQHKPKPATKVSLLGTIGGIFSGLLPGITPSQIASFITQKGENFLVVIGAITTSNILISFLAIKLISHPRSGIAVVMQQLLTIGFVEIIIIIIISLIAVIVSFFTTLNISKFILKHIHKLNYTYISLGILIFLNIIIFYFTHIYGLLIAWTGCFIGLSSLLHNVRRHNLMACLIVPTILFYFGIQTGFLL